jgi:hypothetical protein
VEDKADVVTVLPVQKAMKRLHAHVWLAGLLVGSVGPPTSDFHRVFQTVWWRSEALAPLAAENGRIGGRRAQHDLIEFTLLKAYLEADRADMRSACSARGDPVLPAFRSRGWPRRIERARLLRLRRFRLAPLRARGNQPDYLLLAAGRRYAAAGWLRGSSRDRPKRVAAAIADSVPRPAVPSSPSRVHHVTLGPGRVRT